MITGLLILFIIVWLPLLLYQMTNRGFVVLLVWLFIAPVASNIINLPSRNPFFQSPDEYRSRYVDKVTKDFYFTEESKIELRRWFEPTRLLFISFIIVFILKGLLRQQRLGPFDSVEIWMFLLTLILLLSTFLKSINRIYSLRVVLDGFMVPFLAYFISRRFVTTERRLIQLNQVFIYMATYLIILGLIERMVHYDVLTYRLEGPFRNKHAISIATILPFFVVLADTLYAGSVRAGKVIVARSVRWFVLILAPVIVGISMTRGVWVGFLLGLWGFVAMGGRMIGISRKMITWGLFLLLLPMATALILALTPSEIIEGRVVGESTVYGRIATWTALLQAGAKSPLFGIGLNNSRNVLYDTKLQFHGLNRYKSVHNSYLALFVEQGIIGLFAYLAIVTCIMRMGMSLYRKGSQPRERWWGVIVVAVMIAYLVPALFESKLHTPNAMLSVYVYALVGGVAGLYGRHRVGTPVYRIYGGGSRGEARQDRGGIVTSGRNLRM
jgi:O-antigen ligase